MLSQKDLIIPCKLYPKKASVYLDDGRELKAAVLYFHGGGLLFGSREDLPEAHIRALCSEAYAVLAFDYPLAPAADIEIIIRDVCSSVEYYVENRKSLLGTAVPYFLFGRSAGAYLTLLAGMRRLSEPPAGIISYYGFGFLCGLWYNNPSKYYLSFPAAPAPAELFSSPMTPNGDLQTHYGAYVYARQHGNWIKLFYPGREKTFLCEYSLRGRDRTDLPYPLFCAHSENDPDVPFEEYIELCKKFNVTSKFAVSDAMHDFDRNTRSRSTKKLLDATLDFMNSLCSRE